MTSSSERFETWWSEYQRTGGLGEIQLEKTRDQIKLLFGKPDEERQLEFLWIDGVPENPVINSWKFGQVQFCFDEKGRLRRVFVDMENPNPRVILE